MGKRRASAKKAAKRDPLYIDGVRPRPMYVDYKDLELLGKLTNRHGRIIGTTGAKPQPPGAPPPTPAGAYEHPLGERLDPRWLYFNPPAEHRTTAWANHPTNPLRAN